MSLLHSLSRIVLVSRGPETLAVFYESAFGFVRSGERRLAGPALASLLGIAGAKARVVELRLGGQKLELLGIEPQGHAYPADVPVWSTQFQHFAIVVTGMPAAYAKLNAIKGWSRVSTDGPQVLPQSSGGVTAFKFRDPEGHPLELLAFPPDAIPKKWQAASANGFLGIDHSAISVASTSRSLEFYRRIGLQRAGGSCNAGPAQDRLDGADGMLAEVTALAPREAPPHIELLCYRKVGRNPAVASLNDVIATQLVLSARSTAELAAICARNADALVSGPIPFGDGAARAMMRDPDGHLIRLEGPL